MSRLNLFTIVVIGMFALGMLMWDYADTKQALITAQADHSAALQDAALWRAKATALEGQQTALNDVATACLQREAAARDDAEDREAIMDMGPARPLTQQDKDQGVSHATRRAAAVYLNRPL